MTPWLSRWRYAPMPYQTWAPFPPEAIVQVKNRDGESNIGPASSFWWGYQHMDDGTIVKARRLDTPRRPLRRL